jgi:hypothetical protein
VSLQDKNRLVIPLKNVAKGAEVCLDNAAQFCCDARALVEIKSCEHALGLCIYAIEELGKAELLIEISAYAAKKGEESITLENTKAQDFFNGLSSEVLQKMGFPKKINPFFDHRSKLLYAKGIMYIAANDRLWRSLEGMSFQDFDEITKAYEKLDTPAYVSCVKGTEIRELSLYVGYDSIKGTWIKDVLNTTPSKVIEILTDIEKAIGLSKTAIHLYQK